MLAYWWVLNDYGFSPAQTIFLNQREGFIPLATDVYDADQPNFGNSNYFDSDWSDTIDWGLVGKSKVDLRLYYNGFAASDYPKCRWDPNDTSIPHFYRISPHTHRQVCYTSEALLYAQSAYFSAAILFQISNNLISRSRFLSIA